MMSHDFFSAFGSFSTILENFGNLQFFFWPNAKQFRQKLTYLALTWKISILTLQWLDQLTSNLVWWCNSINPNWWLVNYYVTYFFCHGNLYLLLNFMKFHYFWKKLQSYPTQSIQILHGDIILKYTLFAMMLHFFC